MHREDAIKFLIENIAASPRVFAESYFDVSLPTAIRSFLLAQNPTDTRLRNDYERFREEEFSAVWIAFFDAHGNCADAAFLGWENLPRGILEDRVTLSLTDTRSHVPDKIGLEVQRANTIRPHRIATCKP
jgi:hypothetical protein